MRGKLAAVGHRRVLTIMHAGYAAFLRWHCGGPDGTLPRLPIYRCLTYDSFRTKQMDGKCRAVEGYHFKYICCNAVSGGRPCAHITGAIGFHEEKYNELAGVLPTLCSSADCNGKDKELLLEVDGRLHRVQQRDVMCADWKAAAEGAGICITSGRPCPGCACCRKDYGQVLALDAAAEDCLPQREQLAADIAARFQRCHERAAERMQSSLAPVPATVLCAPPAAPATAAGTVDLHAAPPSAQAGPAPSDGQLSQHPGEHSSPLAQ